MIDNTLLIIHNVFSDREKNAISQELNNYSWELTNYSVDSNGPFFWAKRLYNSIICKNIFKSRIEISTKLEVEIKRIQVNGQTHGQCGIWHTDETCHDPSDIAFTLVYFPYEWRPEYGGHLLVKVNNEVQSILPEYNKGVIFSTSTEHLGLEPTIYCNYMRESIACTFKVKNN